MWDKPSSACWWSGGVSRGSPVFAPPYDWLGSKWMKLSGRVVKPKSKTNKKMSIKSTKIKDYNHSYDHITITFFEFSLIWMQQKKIITSYLIKVYLCYRMQGDQVPGKITSSPEAQNNFSKPGIWKKKKKTNFLICVGIFTNFDKYTGQKSAHFVRNCVYDAKNQNWGPIFATAGKNIFGKVVTLTMAASYIIPCDFIHRLFPAQKITSQLARRPSLNRTHILKELEGKYF